MWNGSLPSPVHLPSEQSLWLNTKQKTENNEEPNPQLHSNTHIPEIEPPRTHSQAKRQTRFLWAPLSSSCLYCFFILGMPQHKKKPSLTFFLPFKTKQVSELAKHKCKIMKNNHKWKLQLLKYMGTNYWSHDMMNKKKATCLDKRKSFKVINIQGFVFPHLLEAAIGLYCLTN